MTKKTNEIIKGLEEITSKGFSITDGLALLNPKLTYASVRDEEVMIENEDGEMEPQFIEFQPLLEENTMWNNFIVTCYPVEPGKIAELQSGAMLEYTAACRIFFKDNIYKDILFDHYASYKAEEFSKREEKDNFLEQIGKMLPEQEANRIKQEVNKIAKAK